MEFIKAIGTREQVFNGICRSTKGGLMKDGLILDKNGKIISKRKSEASRAMFERNKLNMKQYKVKATE